MIESIITDYLRQNRRLVIPELGAFLKKEEGEMVFVPFLSKDDGILGDLVRRAYGASSAETEGIIAKYVENVRNGIEGKGAYLVFPLGSLKKDPNGFLFLDTAALAPPPAARETATVPVQEPEKAPPAAESVSVPEASEPEPVPEMHEFIRPIPIQPEENSRILAETVDAPKTLNDLIREKQERQEQPSTIHERASEPVGIPNPVRKPATPPAPQQKPLATPAQKEREKRGDAILIAAVVVAIIAVIAMIYAYAVVDLPLFNLQ